MFYFSYVFGEFYVIREFNDSYDFEIVDILPFYDFRRIYHWCKRADIEFPYEMNDSVLRIISNIYPNDSYSNCFLLFDTLVANGDVKLYCEEKIQ